MDGGCISFVDKNNLHTNHFGLVNVKGIHGNFSYYLDLIHEASIGGLVFHGET